MNEMLDAQNSLYDAAFVSAEEFYGELPTLDFN
jgi:hypothetical protein